MWQKIKYVCRRIREYKKYAIMTPLFMIGEAGVECCIPFVMSLLLDKIDDLKDIRSLWPYLVALIGMAIISITCGILGGITAAKASTGFAKNLRHDLYVKLQSYSFANIDKFSSSSLVTRMTTDIANTQMAFQMCIRIVVRAPLMFLFSVIMSFISGGLLALIFVGLIPVVVIGLLIIIKKALPVFRRVFKRYDLLNQSVEENVSGIRVVKSFVREDYEKTKFNNASFSISLEFIKAEKIVAWNNPLMNTAIHLSNLLVLSIGSWLILTTSNYNPTSKDYIWGQLSPAQMSTCITYGLQILTSLMMISMIIVMLVMSIESIKRVAEVLEEVPTIVNPNEPVYEIADGSIDFDNVDFKYFQNAEKNTLEDINIHIKSGQFVGILGATGSGKTSVVNLISRLYDVNNGSVKVGGVDVKNYDLKVLRDNVSVVLQKNVLFSGTIASNLKWGNKNATNEEMIQALTHAQALEILRGEGEQGLEKKVEQGGANFSGGQKQRLCIARALLKKPKILILDDSTSAVDTKTDRLIRKALKDDLSDMTKIVIAQRISSIEEADQIIVMNDGHIDAIGTHDDLIKNNKIYQEVYNTQNKVGGEQ